MPKKICNKCKFQQDEFLHIGGRNYCKNCNSIIYNQHGYNPYLNESESSNSKGSRTGAGGVSDLDNLSAYDKKVIYDMFYMSIEWLEKYIEIAYKNEFPNWENRKQIRDNLTITRTDIYSNPEKAKKAFSTQMFLFGTSLEDVPIFREDLKKELRQWISAVKIDDSCPSELKHILYGFSEVMDGDIEKVRRDMANRKREYEIDSPGYMKKMTELFANVQVPMHNERKTKKSLGNTTHLGMEFGSRFSGGNVEQGEQVLSKIVGSVANRHDDFHFYPQKSQQISGYLTTGGAVINNEPYEEVNEEIQATPEQIEEVNKTQQELNQNNSNEMKWIPVGIGGAGLFALVVAGTVKIFKPSVR